MDISKMTMAKFLNFDTISPDSSDYAYGASIQITSSLNGFLRFLWMPLLYEQHFSKHMIEE